MCSKDLPVAGLRAPGKASSRDLSISGTTEFTATLAGWNGTSPRAQVVEVVVARNEVVHIGVGSVSWSALAYVEDAHFATYSLSDQKRQSMETFIFTLRSWGLVKFG